jgi:HAD superfamily hydrolase (TIGR01457 family)
MKNISGLEGFLIDLDGTIYLGDHIIPGAPEFISALRRKKKDFLFLSNNSSKSRASYKNKLSRLGIEVNQENILNSTVATADLLSAQFPHATVFPVGTPDFEAELISLGIKISHSDADIVLLGFDTTLTYDKIRNASKLISEGAQFFATHGDVMCPTENGFIPDIGTFIPLFEKATGKSPTIIGKPYRPIIDSALTRLKIAPESIGMVGDRLYTDIKMAKNFALTSILVLSGETKITDLSGSELSPDYVFRSVREIVPYL